MNQENRDKHSKYSSIREEYVEYAFLSQICSYAWQTGRFVEVARSHTDAFGYDVILTCEGKSRHVQLKAMKVGGKASFQPINTNLANAPSGCVLWLIVNEETLTPETYGWFGASPSQPLPPLGDDVAKHTKGNSQGEKTERSAIRKLKKREFDWKENIQQVFGELFGE